MCTALRERRRARRPHPKKGEEDDRALSAEEVEERVAGWSGRSRRSAQAAAFEMSTVLQLC